MILNPYRFATPAGGGYVVDDYSPEGAWSLREIASAYVDVDIITVRRSSDNTTDTFTATEITDGTLTTFTGANNGFVTNLVDQTGGGNDLINNTLTQQPQIVSAGTLLTQGGKPTIKFVEANDNQLNTTASNSWFVGSDWSVFSVAYMDENVAANYIWSTNTNTSRKRRACVNVAPEQLYFNDAGVNEALCGTSDGWTDLTQCAVTMIGTGMLTGETHTVDMWINGGGNQSSTSTGQLTPSNQRFVLGSPAVGTATFTWNGNMQECIVFASDKTSDRAAIDSDITTHYGL